ncbi:transglycosylase domain-containing protein [Fervidibacillus halotolerans]|uniref:Penicillin-binding protein n=1 Tax=Fervidibacillus halotolerans TaxID=2980027 RepID=A0A9E8RWG6_9BACI|nr:transglycosylase domain-containing protein [Fervidibacillus halotolerans]WAA11730.1 penicillin-binding protein [Fervidibacillus halotolerans]
MKKHFDKFLDIIKPMKDTIFSKKAAKAFRITYSVVWNLILIFLISGVLLFALGVGVGAGYFASLVKDEYPRPYDEMRKDIYNYEEPSELYFANGEFAGYLRSDIVREEVKLEDVSEYFLNAVIATEDENFEHHNGVVPKAVLRALFQEVTNAPVQSGGSTLTQQLIKNQILTNEVSFERKAKEILLALRLENFFDKDEILEAYINVSSFGRNSSGQNIAGVQAAAKGIFGVDAKDLNLPQAAYIAGLPQSPNGYTPFTRDGEVKSEEGLEPGLNRQKTVLKRMYENGFISKKVYDEALEYDIVKDFIDSVETPMEKYPYLMMESERQAINILMQQLYEKDGYTKEDVENSEILYERYEALAIRNLRQNGYKIYTTIHKDIYEQFQKVVANFKNYGPDKPEQKKNEETGKMETVYEKLEVGAMLIDNATGKIISFVGGRDFYDNQLNHATQAYRHNGSSMKPLVVYGPAIDMGLAAPGTVLTDVDLGIRVDGRPWPQNYAKKYYGLTSAREALTHSHNVSAVYLFNEIAQNNPVKYLEKMGITRLVPSDYENPSAALGSTANGVSVEENTNAFATFGNGGQFIDAYMIDKIEDRDGNVIYEHESKPVEVFSPQSAYLTVDMMRNVVRNGTARAIPGYLKFSADFAGKTGTSQETRDIWFVGLNPNITMGIWMGYSTPKTITSGSIHLKLWAQLMNATYDVDPNIIGPKDRFQMPGGIVKRTYCGVSGLLPSEACSKAGLVQSDYFIAKYVPTETDNSLIEGKYVTIEDKNYLALNSTPDEFAKSGFILNPDFIKEIAPQLKEDEYEQLIPNNSKWNQIIVPSAKIEENGKNPAPIKIALSSNGIKWSKHGEKDVIGYRVYRIQGDQIEQIGSIIAGESLSFKLSATGFYAVTAVDIAGNESELSNIIQYGTIIEQPPTDQEDGEDETDHSDDSDDNSDDSPEEPTDSGVNYES